jgi:uracil DNA glycosylase
MTTGPDNCYLSDHSVLWEEFIREFVNYVDKPTILIGSSTWGIDAKFCIKVPCPMSEDKFIGCDVFIKANQHLDDPILWLKI